METYEKGSLGRPAALGTGLEAEGNELLTHELGRSLLPARKD